MSASGDWLLKIISGPHQGAEVLLKPGRLVVGSHPDCDLVLHDVLVAAQHFALTLEKGVLTVEPLEGRVFTQGKRVEARGTVREFGFVTAGTTHLVLGMTIFLIFPFTRLVHILSAPVWYLGRRGYQIVRTRKSEKA